ncbi:MULTISPECIES: hypothetical protein [unclassified Curtobacterium]|uniref:hypothetical protein n=1 Tax=unclassified Curtobacterium TaxID=257496 RepID=UPI0011147AD7|nr:MULTISPECIES: hypothetical protein [unclassified Curtobacterium]WIA97519.1 hypothetical protein QOL16_03750 [Curtobacterium sp. MCBA15_004]
MHDRLPVAAVLAAVTLAATTGCSSVSTTPPVDPVGSWTLSSDPSSRMVLHEDGSLAVVDMPYDIACDVDAPWSGLPECADRSAPVSFTGTWRLADGDPHAVRLATDDRRVSTGYREGAVLGFWVGSLDRPEPTYRYVHD